MHERRSQDLLGKVSQLFLEASKIGARTVMPLRRGFDATMFDVPNPKMILGMIWAKGVKRSCEVISDN